MQFIKTVSIENILVWFYYNEENNELLLKADNQTPESKELVIEVEDCLSSDEEVRQYCSTIEKELVDSWLKRRFDSLANF